MIGAAIGLFALSGFGVVRLCLPDSLRATRAAWILPVGACTSALVLAVLGFANVPMGTSLWVTIAVGAGVALAVLARSRRLGAPAPVGGEPRRRIAGMPVVWALYIAALIGFLALIPLIRSGFPTVSGDGSDAHLAAGTAQFLAHHAPTTVHPQEPVNQVPALWRSKVPIYYVFAAVASLSGLPTYEVLTPLSAVMFGLAIIGFFLIATEILRATPALAGLAAGAVGLDREVLFTVIHPFYNQTWGLFTTPFAMVLGWVVVADGGSRRTLGTVVLLALFLALCGFAYPLALPIPLLAIGVFWLSDRRERRRRGETVTPLLAPPWKGRRSLLWLVPLGLILAVPVLGSLEKLWEGATVLLDPSQSLSAWAGGMTAYIFEPCSSTSRPGGAS